MAWHSISSEVSVKGFRRCCIANAMDETDDNMLWNGSEEDGNIRSGCEGDEGTDWYRQIESDMLFILCICN